MPSQHLKLRLSLNWLMMVLFVLIGAILVAASLESLLGAPMLTTVQFGPWYGSFLPFH